MASLPVRHHSFFISGVASAWHGRTADKAHQRESNMCRLLVPAVLWGPGSITASVQVPSSATDIFSHLMKEVPCDRTGNTTTGGVLSSSPRNMESKRPCKVVLKRAQSKAKFFHLGGLLEVVY